METALAYIRDQFCRQYGLSRAPEIGYGFEHPAGVRVSDAGRAFLTTRARPDYERIRWHDFGGTRLPVVFHDGSEALISHHGGTTYLHFDWFAECFFWLSGFQECGASARDRYGRFRWQDSLQHRLGITTLPVVNYWFELMARELGIAVQREAGGTTCTIALTHDIDRITSGWAEDSWYCLRRGKPGQAAAILTRKLRGHLHWQTLEEMTAAEHRHGATSAFYVLPEQGTRRGIPHADYDLRSPAIRELMQRLDRQGQEIGIHPPAGSHLDDGELQNALRRTDFDVAGGRFHFLSFDMDTTPGVLERSGLRYDSTLGFAEHIGFRNGYCFPFYLFDHQANRPTGVQEIPLAVMDTTLRNPGYMGVAPEEVTEAIAPVTRELRHFGGTSALLWHNNMYSSYKYRRWREAYDRLLGDLEQRDCRMRAGREVLWREEV